MLSVVGSDRLLGRREEFCLRKLRHKVRAEDLSEAAAEEMNRQAGRLPLLNVMDTELSLCNGPVALRRGSSRAARRIVLGVAVDTSHRTREDVCCVVLESIR